MSNKKDYGNLIDSIPADLHKKMEGLYKQVKPHREFEFMFFNYRENIMMNLETFLRVLRFLNIRHRMDKDKMKIVKSNSLDVSYSASDDRMINYRLSINGLEQINRLLGMFHTMRNHVIYMAILTKYLQKEKGIELMKKIKNLDHIVDVDDLKLRARLSEEKDVSGPEIDELQKLDEVSRQRIYFRHKERVSLTVYEDANIALRIDLTKTNQSNNINRLEHAVPRYELELEIVPKKVMGKPDPKYFAKAYHEVELLLKVIQQSNYLMTESKSQEVLTQYQNLLGVESNRMYSLAGRQAYSLEIQHLVDILPNKFAVTDKADGERQFLIILANHVYMINNNMTVLNTGIELPKNLSKYNGTILDGELIFVNSLNRYLFMAFDCLHSGDDDIRGIQSLLERHQAIDQIVSDCFIQKGHKGRIQKHYKGDFKIDKILKFYGQEIEEVMSNLNHDLKVDTKVPLVRRKFFIPVLGGAKNEVFQYSKLMWNNFTRNPKINCPYTLDGLVYHPLDQKYTTTVKDTKFHEYKWKPENKNSIDFYVTFERDPETGKVVTLYDNSREEYIRGKPYKICYLHVGKATRNGEQPTLFQREAGKHVAYLFLEDGDVRTPDGNIIQDKTVVEFYYNLDSNVEDKFRWVPMKTRYDKTESVIRHRKKYGNYVDIANRVWRSIINPIRYDDLNILANEGNYEAHNEKMRKKIDHSLIMSERKENIYYQIRTNLAQPMRNFHNFIKSIIIYTYFNPTYNHGKKLSVLDIACGRGGDIMKFFYSRVSNYVGIDIDNTSLIAATDGALSRYRQMKKSHPNFPPMSFIHADGRMLLNYNDQLKALGSMSDMNKTLINKFFSTDERRRARFDGINCQFALHYFLESQVTWDNFCDNVKNYLRPGGYALFSCFDGQRVARFLKGKKSNTVYYTNEKGEKMVLFDIKKMYEELDDDKVYGVGNAIDVHNSLINQEDVYITEYLVDIRFLTQQLSEKCDLELVESNFFDHIYHVNKDYFDNVEEHEGNPKTRKFLEKAGTYYNKGEVNKACFEMSRLNRYFIFRRRDNGSGGQIGSEDKFGTRDSRYQKDTPRDEKPAKKTKSKNKTKSKKQKGGGNNYPLDNLRYLLGEGFFRGTNSLSDSSFIDAITENLRTQKIIPSSLTSEQLFHDLGLPVKNDPDLTTNDIKKMCRMEIEHQEESGNKAMLSGLDIYVLNEDCDGDAEVTRYKSRRKKNKRAMILYNDGNAYYPVFRENDSKAVFLPTDGLVQNLEESL